MLLAAAWLLVVARLAGRWHLLARSCACSCCRAHAWTYTYCRLDCRHLRLSRGHLAGWKNNRLGGGSLGHWAYRGSLGRPVLVARSVSSPQVRLDVCLWLLLLTRCRLLSFLLLDNSSNCHRLRPLSPRLCLSLLTLLLQILDLLLKPLLLLLGRKQVVLKLLLVVLCQLQLAYDGL